MIKSKQNTEHYVWGGNCDSWVLLDSQELAIKQEIMPPKSKEILHFHKNAQQFFFILHAPVCNVKVTLQVII